jgi:tetratricopeptide (TPR) repeat protein
MGTRGTRSTAARSAPAYIALLLTSAIGALTAAGCSRNQTCHDLAEEESWAAAKVVCAGELAAHFTAETALDLGRARMNTGDDKGGLQAAEQALAAAASTTALRLVGTLHDRLGNGATGRRFLETALDTSSNEGDGDGVARAALGLAGSFWRESSFADVDRWLRVAETTEVPPEAKTHGSVAILRGDLHRRVGDADEAEAAYARADKDLRPFPSKVSWVLFKRGKLHLERGALSAAAQLLEEAHALADETGQVDVQRAAVAALTELALKQGRRADAEKWLARWDGGRPTFYLRALAQLELARGNAPAAEATLGEAIAATRDSETSWELHHERGRMLEQLQKPAEAEAAYRASITEIEKLRATLSGSLLQPWLLARRRQPYEALFRVLAARGDTREVLRVLESLTARSFLEFVSGQPQGDTTSRLAHAAALAALQSGLLVEPGAADDSSREALVVVEADGRFWTIHRRPGAPLRIEDRGDSESVRAAMRALDENSNDADAAERLGELLVPSSVAAGDAILYIVPAGELLRVPWAALRRGGKPLISERALAIAPSLALLGALRPASYDGGSLVVGDPDGTLAAARQEVQRAASVLGTTPRIGTQATRAALYETPEPWLLHIASHAASDSAGGSLRLADGELTAGEVLEAGFSARVAILSGCATARTRHREMWGSLAAALLANGTGTVIATLRSVDDEAARSLIARAYEHDLARDPVRALAAAQREAIATHDVEDWSSFVAYDIATIPEWIAAPSSVRQPGIRGPRAERAPGQRDRSARMEDTP